jgi:hypothetical protein
VLCKIGYELARETEVGLVGTCVEGPEEEEGEEGLISNIMVNLKIYFDFVVDAIWS